MLNGIVKKSAVVPHRPILDVILEVLARIAQTTAALGKLKYIRRDRITSLGTKVNLMRSLVMSVFLYGCEAWTLNAELQRQIQALEMRSLCRLLGISYKDLVTNEEVRNRVAKITYSAFSKQKSSEGMAM